MYLLVIYTTFRVCTIYASKLLMFRPTSKKMYRLVKLIMVPLFFTVLIWNASKRGESPSDSDLYGVPQGVSLILGWNFSCNNKLRILSSIWETCFNSSFLILTTRFFLFTNKIGFVMVLIYGTRSRGLWWWASLWWPSVPNLHFCAKNVHFKKTSPLPGYIGLISFNYKSIN